MAKILPKKNSDGSLPLTPNNLYFTFQQFLVTWINIITKERGIYPPESYEIRNSFNLQCPYNRHPDVINWNNELIGDVMDELCFKKIKLISLVLFDKETQESKERYSVNLFEFLHTSVNYYDKQIIGFDDLSWKKVYDEFRANIYSLLAKIRTLPSINHNDLNHKLSYTIVLETQDVALNPNWVLEDDNTNNSVGTNYKSKMNIKHNGNNMDDNGVNNGHDNNDIGNTNDGNDISDDGKYEGIEIMALRNVDIGPIIFYSSIELMN